MYNRCNKTAWGNENYNDFGKGAFGRYARAHWAHGFRRPINNVPVNIIDGEKAYEAYVYATGFDKENIKISVADDILYITGTRTMDEAHPPKFSSQEFPVKSFERVIGLNETVDKKAITARQEAGVLIITLPKTAAAQTPAQEIKVD